MVLLHRTGAARESLGQMTVSSPQEQEHHGAAVEVRDLVRQFGAFTAVDHINFEVQRGEIFGLLGPNGAGKTTTFRMLCGLLPATSGTLRVAGVDLRRARASARQRIGYVAQKFSLYGQLSVVENLEFFASAYSLRGAHKQSRMDWALSEFDLGEFVDLPSGDLPGGYKQRLAMAAALLHEPQLLFLDEPTSGADPLARVSSGGGLPRWPSKASRSSSRHTSWKKPNTVTGWPSWTPVAFWRKELPPRSAAEGEPNRGRCPTWRTHSFRSWSRRGTTKQRTAVQREGPHDSNTATFSARMHRALSLIRKEARQIIRDPSSIAIGIVLPVVLILLFGYGLSLDVNEVPVAVVLEDTSPTATDLAASFQLSPYFAVQPMTSMPRAEELMLSRKVDGIIRIRPDFGRRVNLGDAEVQVLVHGVDANHARIIQGYAQGAVGQWMARRAAQGYAAASGPVVVQSRMWFNEANESRYFLVPGLIVLIMTLIGALLTALVMAREWERGTFEALFVTPVRTNEILLGKTIPYFALGIIGLGLCLVAAKFLFHVPFRGSVAMLTVSSVVYLLVALGIGLLISSAFRSQFVASQITVLVTFLPAVMLSGFLFDLRSMPAFVRVLTYVLPARYYVALLQTIFLAGDIWAVILPNIAVLTGMAALLWTFTYRAARKSLA